MSRYLILVFVVPVVILWMRWQKATPETRTFKGCARVAWWAWKVMP